MTPIPTKEAVGHTADFYPAPWSIEIIANRARVVDADGCQIISGMNIEKANIIVSAFNVRTEMAAVLAKIVGIYQSSLEEHLGEKLATEIRAALSKAKGE